MRRRNQGEPLSDEQIIAGRADLMPQLGDELRKLAIVETAVRVGRQNAVSPTTVLVDAAVVQTGVPPSDSFPGYDLIDEIHRGGQGVVYRAIQKSTRRRVAIKVMKEGPFAGPSDRARFDREVQALGALDHPNIVTIHESGSAAGSPYFVMNYVSGRPLDEHVRKVEKSKSQKTEIEDLLRLFAKICHAVSAAHLRGIIHRDLKPSNIRVDDGGEPHVLDFGLARSASQTDASMMTITGQFVGSLPWASPEQAEGIPGRIDVRTDVYSLGVILYHMLAGRFPYDVVGNMRDVIDNILRAEPAKPRTFNRQIDDEVETIVLKCLSKDRERRYQSAGELARDVEHYLAGEPIEAKRDSTLYILRKQLRRYRMPLAVATGFVLLLIASSVVAWTLYIRSQTNLRQSYLAQARAGRLTGRPGQRFDSLDAVAKAAAIRPSVELRTEVIACLALTDMRIIKQVETGLRTPNGRWEFSGRGDSFWLYEVAKGRTTVRRFADNETLLTLPDVPSGSYWTYPRFSRDGRYLARSVGRQCEVWDIERAELVTTVSADVSHRAHPNAFRPDGQEIAVGCEDGSIHIHDLTSSDARVLPPVHAPVHEIRYHPAGNLLATSSIRSHDALIRDALTGEVLHTLNHPHRVWCIAWSPDGRQLTTACEDGNAYVWSARTGVQQFNLKGHMSAVVLVGFNHTGDLLFSASWDGTTRLWDPRSGNHLLTLPALQGYSFAVDSNRLYLDTRSQDLCVAVAEIVHGDTFRSLVGHPADIPRDSCQSIRVSRDGRWLASASHAGVRVWNLVHGQPVALLPTGSSRSAVFHPNGSALITVGETGVLRWPLEIDSEAIRIGPPEILFHQSRSYLMESCLTSDGSTLVVSEPDAGHAVVLHLDEDRERRTIGPHQGVRYVSISPDDQWLATGPAGAEGVKIWDLTSGELVHELPTAGSASVAFSPDGKWLVTSAAEHVIWHAGTWEARARFPRANFSSVAGPIAFSPDGKLLAVADQAPPFQLALLNVARLEQIATLECPGDMVMPESLVFTPDGTQLVFPNPQAGHIVYVWDLRVIRRHLAAMNLDWDLPPYPPAPPKRDVRPLRVEIDLGELEPPPSTDPTAASSAGQSCKSGRRTWVLGWHT